MSMNKWTIKKKLSVLVLLALTVAMSFFLISYNLITPRLTSQLGVKDGPAEAIINNYLSLYERILAFEIVGAVVIFTVILVLGIRQEVKYIKTINDEIHALEGGDLTTEITIRGSDEVAMLAESVDEFRISMKEHLNTIEQLEKSNRMMTAEIAHDLRTPLTSLFMYLDFTLTELEDREPLAREYVTKAKEKSIRLRNLLEENFNYTTMPDYFAIEKQPVSAHEALSGLLNDMMNHLESEDFYVRTDILFGHSKILVERDALGRVFGNLLTNIMKYAKRDTEVHFYIREKDKFVEVRIANHVRTFEGEEPESTGFGARIVKRLMEEMHGEYMTEEEEGVYTTILRFAKA